MHVTTQEDSANAMYSDSNVNTQLDGQSCRRVAYRDEAMSRPCSLTVGVFMPSRGTRAWFPFTGVGGSLVQISRNVTRELRFIFFDKRPRFLGRLARRGNGGSGGRLTAATTC